MRMNSGRSISWARHLFFVGLLFLHRQGRVSPEGVEDAVAAPHQSPSELLLFFRSDLWAFEPKPKDEKNASDEPHMSVDKWIYQLQKAERLEGFGSKPLELRARDLACQGLRPDDLLLEPFLELV